MQTEGAVYIENVFLINLVMNYFLLRLTGSMMGKSATVKRCFAGSLTGAAGYCILICIPTKAHRGMAVLSIILVGSIMIKLGLGLKGKREFLYGMGWLFTFSFLMGGFMLFLKSRLISFNLWGKSTFLTAALGLVGYEWIRKGIECQKQKKEARFRKVKLKTDTGEIEIWALVDTGCGLVDPVSKKPVAIMESSIWNQMQQQKRPEKYKLIPFHSIGKEHGLLEGYEVDAITVEGESGMCHYQNVIIAVFKGKISKNGGYRMILPPELSI